MSVIAKVHLPCNLSQLEAMMHRAAHEGHWHDAQIKMGENGEELVIYHQ